MADGLVDLQDHLVGHQQQVTRAVGRIRCEQQLQGFVGHLAGGAHQAKTLDHPGTALLAEVGTAQGTGLAVVAVEGGHTQARKDKALGLTQLGAGAVEVDLFNPRGPQADFPAHQALILGHGGGLIAEQLVAVAQGREGLVEVGRQVVGDVAGHRLLVQVEQGVGLDKPGLLFSALKGGLQAGKGNIVGRGVGFHAVETHGEHGAFVMAQVRRLGDVLAHRQVLAGFANVAQGEKFGGGAQGTEVFLERGVVFEHGAFLVGGSARAGKQSRPGRGADQGKCRRVILRCLVGPHRGQARLPQLTELFRRTRSTVGAGLPATQAPRCWSYCANGPTSRNGLPRTGASPAT